MGRISFFPLEVLGFFFVFFFGALLHMVYGWSEGNAIVGLISPVKESIWEHLKMLFVPGLILLAVELFFCKEVPVPALIVRKTLGIYVMYATILGGFYFYTLFIHHNLIVDILLMALAVALGQIISYNVVSKLNVSTAAEWIPLVILIFLGAAFVLFRFIPARWEPFRDSIAGGYGTN